jgi:hypothetical protein
MAKNSDKSFGKGEKPEPEAETSAAGPGDKPERPVDHILPMVEAPKLADGDPVMSAAADSMDEMPKIAAGETIMPPAAEAAHAPAAVAPRWSRFAMLAATVALAAGIGSFLGALAVSGFVGHASSRVAMAGAQTGADPQAMKQQLTELAAIKSSLDSASRSTAAQFAKLADRLDRVERTQADPAKLAQMADAVDRIDKRTAASAADITGSIPANASAAEAKPPVVDGWIVEDVQGGRALVASRYGGEFEVGTGAVLPGLGRVEAVKRQDGQWVVVTARGLITSER